MAEKYKLKKDLLGIKSGEILSKCEDTYYRVEFGRNWNDKNYLCAIALDINTLKNNPDYFEEIIPEPKEFTESDMLDFAKEVYIALQTEPTFCPDNWLKGLFSKYLNGKD